MSLMDALLLEPPKFEVWVAIRPPDQMGSGTQADPYNGGTRTGPPFDVQSITSNGTEATVTTLQNHPYVNGDAVVISGVSGDDNRFYNGRFIIFGVSGNTFKYTMDLAPAASTAPGTISCTIDPYLFDFWMRKLGENTHVHLGPGTFLTRGSCFTVNDWQIRSGQRFTGSGIGVTTLKLVEAYRRDSVTYPMAHPGPPYLTSFEASDFTIDCNFEGQPAQAGYDWPPLSCAAISALGTHITFRRIRAINWGTHAIYPGTTNFVVECFVLFSGGGDPNWGNQGLGINCVIEDCIVEKPSKHAPYVSTVIAFTAGDSPSSGVSEYHRASVIRNNYIDCEYNDGAYPLRIGLASLEYQDRPGEPPRRFLLTSDRPHELRIGDPLWLSSVLVGGLLSSIFNDRIFKVQAVDANQPNQLLFDIATDWDPNDPDPDAAEAWIERASQGLGIDIGTGGICEGNRIFNCKIGGPYQDTFGSKNNIVRNNFYSNVCFGIFQNMGGLGPPPVPGYPPGLAVSLAYDSVTGLVTATSRGYDDSAPLAHGLLKGDAVYIGGNVNIDPAYKGYFTVLELDPTDPTKFKYRPLSTPGQLNDAGRWRKLWRVRQVTYEKNIIELALSVASPAHAAAFIFGNGSFCNGSKTDPDNPQSPARTGAPFIFGQIVLRGNVVRHINNAFEPIALPDRSRAAEIHSVENAIVEKNIISLQPHDTIFRTGDLKYVKAFRNLRSSGERVLLFNIDEGLNQFRPEFGDLEIEDSMILSFL
jgi:hypothetical protein